MGCGNKSLFLTSGSHDQDDHQIHIWKKSLKIFFSGTEWPMSSKLSMQYCVLAPNLSRLFRDDLWLTLSFSSFYGKVKLGRRHWYDEKRETADFFSESFVACDIVGLCNQLNEIL